jgi:hypothetical protein
MKGIVRGSCLVAMLLLSGCTSSSGLYYWGSYEDLLYKMYIEPGEAPPERQVEILEAELEIARSKGRPLPPGYRAHLGYLYYQMGKLDLAKQSFEAEREAFPESAMLMDRFIKRLEGV